MRNDADVAEYTEEQLALLRAYIPQKLKQLKSEHGCSWEGLNEVLRTRSKITKGTWSKAAGGKDECVQPKIISAIRRGAFGNDDERMLEVARQYVLMKQAQAREPVTPMLSEIDGWDKAIKSAMDQLRGVPPAWWASLAQQRLSVCPEPLTPEFLVRVVTLIGPYIKT